MTRKCYCFYIANLQSFSWFFSIVLKTEHVSILRDWLLNILNSIKPYTAIALRLKPKQSEQEQLELVILAERRDSLMVGTTKFRLLLNWHRNPYSCIMTWFTRTLCGWSLGNAPWSQLQLTNSHENWKITCDFQSRSWSPVTMYK